MAGAIDRGLPMTVKHLLCCAAATILPASSADALVINLIDLGDVAGSPAKQGFEIAAAYWESVLTNDVTINIGISYVYTDSDFLGSTVSTKMDYSVTDWAAGVAATSSDSQLDRSVVLPTTTDGGGASFVTNGTDAAGNDDAGTLRHVEGTTKSSTTLSLNTALVKAVGGTAVYAADNVRQLDAEIYMGAEAGYDFDPTDGISQTYLHPDSEDGTEPWGYDFIGTAIHEIGHALGFTSGVETLDTYAEPNGQAAGSLGGSVNDEAIYSAVDMFRYSADASNVVEGDDAVLDLSVASESYFSIDGGDTALYGNRLSTGSSNGDGQQASHWKDGAGCDTAGEIGLMDPTSCSGQTAEVKAVDLAVLDAIGWNTNVDALADSGYSATSASIYRRFAAAVPEPDTWAMMLIGFAMIGSVARRRPRGAVRVAFADVATSARPRP